MIWWDESSTWIILFKVILITANSNIRYKVLKLIMFFFFFYYFSLENHISQNSILILKKKKRMYQLFVNEIYNFVKWLHTCYMRTYSIRVTNTIPFYKKRSFCPAHLYFKIHEFKYINESSQLERNSSLNFSLEIFVDENVCFAFPSALSLSKVSRT